MFVPVDPKGHIAVHQTVRMVVGVRLHRLGCPSHRRIVGAVQLVPHRAPFTCESQALAAWLGIKADACAVSRLTPSRRPDRGPAGAVQWPRLRVPARQNAALCRVPMKPVAPQREVTTNPTQTLFNDARTAHGLRHTLTGDPYGELAHIPVPTRFQTRPQ